jgi:flagellar protein FliO/FliZ
MVADTPDFSWLRLLMAFSVVLGLMAALAFVLKYLGARGFALPSKGLRARRLQIVESLSIDTRRRFVIVRCDAREHLLLLNNEGDIVVDANLPPSSPTSPPPHS